MIRVLVVDDEELVHSGLRLILEAAGDTVVVGEARDLASAVRTVAAGNAMLAPTVTRRLIGSFAERGPSKQGRAAHERFTVLTDRERQVVRAVARGLSNAEIGRELAMREATVKTHVSRSLAKLGLANRVQAAILVYEAGLL